MTQGIAPSIRSPLDDGKRVFRRGLISRPRARARATAGGRQDARIHVSEPDFQALTQSWALHDGRPDQGITAADFEGIVRAQLTLYVQARTQLTLYVQARPGAPIGGGAASNRTAEAVG